MVINSCLVVVVVVGGEVMVGRVEWGDELGCDVVVGVGGGE